FESPNTIRVPTALTSQDPQKRKLALILREKRNKPQKNEKNEIDTYPIYHFLSRSTSQPF
ncbi:29986_t:CDS:1, partial [Gigaspora margarita]